MAHTVEINVTSQWSFDASKPNLNNVVERKKARVVREREREPRFLAIVKRHQLRSCISRDKPLAKVGELLLRRPIFFRRRRPKSKLSALERNA
jgi:hypothetical protein